MPRSLHVRDFFVNAKRAVSRALSALHATVRRYPRTALVLLSVGVGVFCTLVPAYAQTPGVCQNSTDLVCQVFNSVFQIIASIAYAIGGLIMGINLVLAWLLISFAKYNVFVNAAPVQIGWPLVRDVVNMFFIVVLLVVAFSTIVGYKDFDYKKILPKLLLMAVLINFSKTLVGVLIDFSQVITLTFVNGFAQAAFGNFAKAFQLSNVLQIAQAGPSLSMAGSTASTAGSQDILSVTMSLLFGIGIMTVTATVLLIMCIYFLARIVMLWMLLIFSPMAFFVIALPAKMSKGVSQFAGTWWKQLGALLSGGPIVAFFLWLTLAVIQQSSTPFPSLYQPASPTEAKSLSPTITKASDPSNITTMMVAVLMLMLGLKTAVDVSREAAPELGRVAESIRSGGGPVGVAARLSYRGARATGRAGVAAAGAAAGAGARAIDRRYDVTGRVGRQLQASGQAWARQGGVLGGALGTALTGAAGRALAVGAKERAEIGKGFEEESRFLSPAGKLARLEARIALADGVGNKREADALKIQKGRMMSAGPGIKARQAEFETEYLARAPAPGDTPEVHAQKAKAYGDVMAKREAAVAIEAAKKSAEAIGNMDVVKELKDAQAKDPSLFLDPEQMGRVMANESDDFKQRWKQKTEAFQNFRFFTGEMDISGLMEKDAATGKARMKEGYQDTEAWQELTRDPNSNRSIYARAQVKAMETEDGQRAAFQQLAALSPGASADIKAAADASNFNVSIAPSGIAYANSSGVNIFSKADLDRPQQVANFAQLMQPVTDNQIRNGMVQALAAQGLTGQALDQFAQRFSTGISNDQAQHIRQNAAVYASPPVVQGAPTPAQATQIAVLARGQSMGIPAPPQAQKVVIDYAVTQAAAGGDVGRLQGAQIISNVRPADIESSPAIRQAIAEALNGRIDALSKAYSAASDQKDASTMKKLEEVVKTVRAESSKAVAAAASANTQLNAVDSMLRDVSDQIKADRVLKKIGERKKA